MCYSIILPLKTLYDKYQVRLIEEFDSMLKEQLEVAALADSDLSRIEQFISSQQNILIFLTVIPISTYKYLQAFKLTLMY